MMNNKPMPRMVYGDLKDSITLLYDDLYDTILDNDEMWFIYKSQSAYLIFDLPIYDC